MLHRELDFNNNKKKLLVTKEPFQRGKKNNYNGKLQANYKGNISIKKV